MVIKFSQPTVCSSPQQLEALGIKQTDFFTTKESPALSRARKACNICPAQMECLDGYLQNKNNLPAGVYAGSTPGQISSAFKSETGIEKLREKLESNLARLAVEGSQEQGAESK